MTKFNFPDWSKAELWILLFTFQAFTYAAFFLFWKGLVHTVRDISRGAFDYLLAKPISSRLITFFRSGGLHNLACLVFSFFGIFITVYVYGLDIHPVRYVGYLALLISSLITFHSVSVIIIALNFYFGYLPATSSATFQIQEIYKYPSTIFGRADIWAWIVIVPFSLFTTIPAMFLLSKPIDYKFHLIYAGFFIVTLIISQLIWNYSTTRYSSSGS